MSKKDLQEDLVKLFLRLNGYFTTGLVIHSPSKGKNITEIDIIGTRFPGHLQKDRGINSCEGLQIPSNAIDIIVGEVKGGNPPIEFNKALSDNEDAQEKLINWIGVCDSKNKEVALKVLKETLNSKETSSKFKQIPIKGLTGLTFLRPIMFCLDKSLPTKDELHYMHGQLILDYIWLCLKPEKRRDACSHIYNYQSWNHELVPIVKYFKDKKGNNPGTMTDFYNHFGE